MTSNSQAYKIVLVCTVVLLAIGMSGILCGLMTDDWFNVKQTFEYNEETLLFSPSKLSSNTYGLSRCCKKSLKNQNIKCVSRDVLSFSEEYIWGWHVRGIDLDQIYALLLAAGIFATLSFSFLILMALVCGTSRTRWKSLAILSFFTIGVSATLTLVASGVGENLYKNNLMTPQNKYPYKHGWAFPAVWCGASSLILSAIFAIVTVFITPFTQDDTIRQTNRRRMALFSSEFTIDRTNNNSYLYMNEHSNYQIDDVHSLWNNFPRPPSYKEALKAYQGKPPEYSENIIENMNTQEEGC